MSARAPSRGGAVELVVFRLAGDRFAFALDDVVEVLGARAVVRRADGPGPAVVTAQSRLGPVPVQDLREALGLDGADPEDDAGEARRVLVVRPRDGELVGLAVDDVEGVREIATDSLSPPPHLYAVHPRERVRAIARLEDGLVVLLDPFDFARANRLAAPAGADSAAG